MATQGQFAVSPSGAATYNIPIQVPPGIAGMEPRLSINYNSQGGNGLLGMGWSLGGLSSIGRCPRTMAQDSVRGGVNLDANDRFCMDGQRLMLVSGVYGLAGSEYRTEMESFSKVTYSGTNFSVQTKAGLTMLYTPALTKNVTVNWGLSKITDAVGNYLTVSYTIDTTNNQFQPSRIDYTGNTGQAPTSSVQFTYDSTRLDIAPMYLAGMQMKNTQRLTKVATYVGSTEVKEYRLAYSAQVSVGDRTKLAAVTECDAAGICFPSISVTWTGTTSPAFTAQLFGNGSSATAYWAGHSGTSNQAFQYTGDFNGDGKSDFMYWGSGGWNVLLATDSGFAPVQIWGSGGGIGYWTGHSGTSNQAFHHTGDFNGDGKTDFMYWGEGGWNVLLSTGSIFAPVQIWGNGGGTGYWTGHSGTSTQIFHYAADFNGDGRTDFMYHGTGGWNMLLSTGSGFAANQVWGTGGSIGYWAGHSTPRSMGGSSQSFHHLGDFNGDGILDFMYWGDGAWNVLLNTGSGFAPKQVWGSGGGTGYWAGHAGSSSQSFHHTGDFNGDGLTDFMYWDVGGWNVLISTGQTFAIKQVWGVGGSIGYWTSHAEGSNQSFHFARDFNGDGLTDFMFRVDGSWSVLLSSGTAFVSAQVLGNAGGLGYWSGHTSPSNQSFHHIGDFNGDGMVDFMYHGTGGWNLLKNNFVNEGTSSFLSSGATINWTKTPLTIPTLYTKDSGTNKASYPLIDLQTPMYVVSSVSTSNGIGGTNTVNYSYGGLKAEMGTGRGMLGFRWMKSKEAATNIETYTEYRQDWPYVGIASLSETRLTGAGNGGLLKQTTASPACRVPSTGQACAVLPNTTAANCNLAANNAACVAAAQSRYFTYTASTTENSWDLGGSAFPSTTTTFDYQANGSDGGVLYGDPTTITVTNSGGATKTTANEYLPASISSGNWILGRLKKATVTSTQP